MAVRIEKEVVMNNRCNCKVQFPLRCKHIEHAKLFYIVTSALIDGSADLDTDSGVFFAQFV